MDGFFLPVPELAGCATGTPVSGGDRGRIPLAGGLVGFRTVRRVGRDGVGAAQFGALQAADDIEDPAWARIWPRIASMRPPFCGVPLDAPVLMGIVNTTPDSFSDGGLHLDAEAAALHGRSLAEAGASIVDFGGESTRPGAGEVSEAEEIRRVIPAIERFRELCPGVPVSIDTRKARVARRAIAAGAGIVNDVSGLARDAEMLEVARESEAFICVMHAQGEPAVMQHAPHYRSALLDVYEWLAGRVDGLERRGIPRSRIAIDPGIGFGKAFGHNIEILSGLALFARDRLCASRRRFPQAIPPRLCGWRDGGRATSRLGRCGDASGGLRCPHPACARRCRDSAGARPLVRPQSVRERVKWRNGATSERMECAAGPTPGR